MGKSLVELGKSLVVFWGCFDKFLNHNQPNNNTRNNSSTNQENNHTNNTTKRNITLVVPYIKGISEKFKKLCKSKGIQVHFKGSNTLRTQLVNPKDKDPKTQKSGIIYHYKCPHINCPEAYIGESGRVLGERVKEHIRPLPQYSITAHPEDIHWTLTTLTLYRRRYIVIPGPSRKQCLYV